MARKETANSVKFRDMTANHLMRIRWLAWAKSHDWGGGEACWTGGDSMLLHVEALSTDEHGDSFIETGTFDNPRELRAWAGY